MEFSNDLFFSLLNEELIQLETYSSRSQHLDTILLINGLKSTCWEQILSDHYDLFFSRFLHKFLPCSCCCTLNTASRRTKSYKSSYSSCAPWIKFLKFAPLCFVVSWLIQWCSSKKMGSNKIQVQSTPSPWWALMPFPSIKNLWHMSNTSLTLWGPCRPFRGFEALFRALSSF